MTDTVDKKTLIAYRDGTLDDLALIYSSWLKGLRYGNDFFKAIDQDTYYARYHQILEAILSRPTTAIRVACLVEEPSVVIGYSVLENSQLHWVFVKKSWRNIGIGRDLVPTNITTVSHITKVGESLLHKSPNVRFNPFL